MKTVQAYWKELAAGVGIGVVIALAIWGVDVTPDIGPSGPFWYLCR